MTTAFFNWVPNLWLYFVLIPVVAWVSGKATRSSIVVAVTAAAILVTTVAYLLPLPGNVAADEPVYAGQVIAVMLSGLLPFAAAGFVGRLQPLRTQSSSTRLALGVVAGLLVLIPLPYVQLALGCTFTAICP